MFKCSSSEQYRNGKKLLKKTQYIKASLCVALFCSSVGFSCTHSSFCEMHYFSWKRNKGNPGAWSSDRWSWMYRYFFVTPSPLFIKCCWILARWISLWNLWYSFTSVCQLLCCSMLEVLNCKQCFTCGRVVWAPFSCPECGGDLGQSPHARAEHSTVVLLQRHVS